MSKALKKNEELVHLAGDAPDPLGTGLRGRQSTHNFTHGKTVVDVRYERGGYRFVLHCDVYPTEGEIMVHLLCPLCRNALRITNAQKAIEFDPRTNQLSIEPFACTWEAAPELRRDFGLARCGFSVAIDKNVAKDA